MADKAPEPMGGGIPEDRDGQVQPLSNRNCWAIDVLIEEVGRLFETLHSTSTPNWLNANMVVVFTPDKDEWEDMALVMPAIEDDDRVEYVNINEDEKTITVQIVANAVLYDTRDSFGLDDAVLGLDDREITPDDFTPLAAEIARGEEGFTEGSL